MYFMHNKSNGKKGGDLNMHLIGVERCSSWKYLQISEAQMFVEGGGIKRN